MDEQVQGHSNDAPKPGEATFALAPDDPRKIENRGGIEAVVSGDDGATGTGRADDSQLGLSTTGLVMGDSAPAGAGPTEGSASGATAPRVEMTDVGLADVNAADMSLPDDGTTGARVEDENGNVL